MSKVHYTPEQQQALNELNTARDEYSRECALAARIRKGLPRKQDLKLPEHIIAYALCSQRVSAAGKKRIAAESKFNALVRPTLEQNKANEILQQIMDAIRGIQTGQIALSKVDINKELERERFANDPLAQKLKKELLEKQKKDIEEDILDDGLRGEL